MEHARPHFNNEGSEWEFFYLEANVAIIVRWGNPEWGLPYFAPGLSLLICEKDVEVSAEGKINRNGCISHEVKVAGSRLEISDSILWLLSKDAREALECAKEFFIRKEEEYEAALRRFGGKTA